MHVNPLSGIKVDVLREIATIGSGNAVSSLAKMLNIKIRMYVPSVSFIEFKDLADTIGGPEQSVVGILVNLSGDINGIMMFVMTIESAKLMVTNLVGRQVTTEFGFDEFQLSALTEIGNILTSSYLASLASFTKKFFKPSVPYISIDMANAILSVPAIEYGKVADRILLIESIFKTDGTDVSGFFLLIPDMPSLSTIFTALGVN